MTETDFDINSTQRQSYSLGLSVGLHAIVLFLMLFNFSWATKDLDKTPPAVLMIDLSKVELGDKTNLPPEVKKKETPKPAAQPKKEQPKKEEPKTKTPAVKKEPPAPKPQPVKPKEKPTPKEAVKVKEPPKPKVKETPKKQAKPKPKAKPTPKKTTPKPQQPVKKPVQETAGLQSLLASVEKVRKAPTPSVTEDSTPETGLEINAGIKGGTGGSRLEALTISEKDFISNKIRECWNVNAGVEGAEEMIIEVKATVNRDGRIQDVRVMNMKNNPVFRSMADSAVRAIHICDRLGDDSPFRMLATKRPEHYSTWKEIYVRMNPVDGGVF